MSTIKIGDKKIGLLEGFTEVSITNPTNGQVLKYDSTSGKFINADESGGAGGHTIIDENGTSMTARAGLQFIGGANVEDDSTNDKTIVDLASAGGIDGVFVDTENVIQSATSIPNGTSTYTATEDCFVAYQLVATSSGCNIQIDNKIIDGLLTGSNYNVVSGNAYLKKGQVIKFVQTSTDAGTYTVYGLQTGITHSKFQPVIYSTEEREVGVWTDGKPLYEKTFLFDYNDLQNETYGKYINLSISNIDKSCLFTISIEDGNTILPYYQNTNIFITAFPILSTDNCAFHFRYGSEVSSQISAYFTNCKIILRYTKSTDTAGSGTWTPQGVPTVHYSTDEHVVGTWIDGSTIYQKTYISNTEIQITTSSSGNNLSSLIDNLSDIKYVIDCFGTNESANGFMTLVADKTSNGFIVYPSIGNSLKTLTLRYTKSS